jgi:hypothetical protein
MVRCNGAHGRLLALLLALPHLAPARALLSRALNSTSADLFTAWPGVLYIETLRLNQPDFVCTATLLAYDVLVTSPSCFDGVDRTADADFDGATSTLAPRPVFAGDAARTLVGHTLRHAYVDTPSVEGGRLSVVKINRSAAGLALPLRPLTVFDGQLYPPVEGLALAYGPASVTRLSEVTFAYAGVRELKAAPVRVDALGSVSAPVGRCGYTLTGGVLATNKPLDDSEAWTALCGNLGDMGAPILVRDTRALGQHQEAGSAANSGYGNWSAAGAPLFGAPPPAASSSTSPADPAAAGGGVWRVAGVFVTADTLYPCATRTAVFTSLAFRGAWLDAAVQRLSHPSGAVDGPVCPSHTPTHTPVPSASPPPSPSPSPSLSPSPVPFHPASPPFPWLAVIVSVVGVLTCGGGLRYWRVHARSRPDASVRVLDAGALASLPKPTLDSRAVAGAEAAAAALAAALREGATATTAPTHHRAHWLAAAAARRDGGEQGAAPLVLVECGRFSRGGHERRHDPSGALPSSHDAGGGHPIPARSPCCPHAIAGGCGCAATAGAVAPRVRRPRSAPAARRRSVGGSRGGLQQQPHPPTTQHSARLLPGAVDDEACREVPGEEAQGLGAGGSSRSVGAMGSSRRIRFDAPVAAPGLLARSCTASSSSSADCALVLSAVAGGRGERVVEGALTRPRGGPELEESCEVRRSASSALAAVLIGGAGGRARRSVSAALPRRTTGAAVVRRLQARTATAAAGVAAQRRGGSAHADGADGDGDGGGGGDQPPSPGSSPASGLAYDMYAYAAALQPGGGDEVCDDGGGEADGVADEGGAEHVVDVDGGAERSAVPWEESSDEGEG